MIHDPRYHNQLAPQDLPHHLAYYHTVSPIDISDRTSHARTCDYLESHGIENTGDAYLDALLVWHEKAHAYSESRTTAQRRAEQIRETR
jgi:hypothetical protein